MHLRIYAKCFGLLLIDDDKQRKNTKEREIFLFFEQEPVGSDKTYQHFYQKPRLFFSILRDCDLRHCENTMCPVLLK
jgi:hypothetical protein